LPNRAEQGGDNPFNVCLHTMTVALLLALVGSLVLMSVIVKRLEKA
jgi:hypothetical protein